MQNIHTATFLSFSKRDCNCDAMAILLINNAKRDSEKKKPEYITKIVSAVDVFMRPPAY